MFLSLPIQVQNLVDYHEQNAEEKLPLVIRQPSIESTLDH